VLFKLLQQYISYSWHSEDFAVFAFDLSEYSMRVNLGMLI
jgi:hypothetical protein